MKRFILATTIFISLAVVPALFSVNSAAASLDFGWGTPVVLTRKIQGGTGKAYIAWPIQVSNSSARKLAMHLDIVAVTDTGDQYMPASDQRVGVPGPARFLTASDLVTNIFPEATRRAVIVFPDVNQKARMIHFYVGGLKDGVIKSENAKYLRITYKKKNAGWVWDGTSVLE